MKNSGKNVRVIETDLCVIGGGTSGIAAAVSAAREGVKVVLIQDRTVLGGNCSSEVRMWVRGAAVQFPDLKEGGIAEELALDDIRLNPKMNWSLWDRVLLNKVRAEENITLILSATVMGADENDGIIRSVTAWKTDEYAFYEVKAKYYADCSGDCVLAGFTSANYMKGRESRARTGESFAPDTPDDTTMGNSVLLQYRVSLPNEQADETAIAKGTERFDEVLGKRCPNGEIDVKNENFWWLELGGDRDSLSDAGVISSDLIDLATAAYAHTAASANAQGYSLDWIGSLGAKRETRRYAGDYVLTATDILSAKAFPDEIAYGGWTIDDHYSGGIDAKEPNIHYRFDKPYPIPYRCVYSNNIDNLFFAGRNVSVTHLALSSTRVMATCMAIGQAVGFAAAVALRHDVTPRGAGKYVSEIQQLLRKHDCYLLNTPREKVIDFPDDERERFCEYPYRDGAKSENPVTVLRIGETITYDFPETYCRKIRIVFDSDLMRRCYDDEDNAWVIRDYPTLCHNACGTQTVFLPPSLVSDFTVTVNGKGGPRIINVSGNAQRLVFSDVNETINSVSFCGLKTHGADEIRLYSIDVIK